jgi:hypothetical protein
MFTTDFKCNTQNSLINLTRHLHIIMHYETARTSSKTLTLKQPEHNSVQPLKTKLIYRGNIFYQMPRPVAKLVKLNGAIVTLICRGNTYQRQMQSPQPYRKPVAINWRWQLPS